MTTFTTIITSMYTLPQIEGEKNVVVTVMYEVVGVDGAHTASIGSNSQFTLSFNAPNFTPYENLTEAQVISWIPESQIMSAQQCVQGQLDSMITPPISPISQALPWMAA